MITFLTAIHISTVVLLVITVLLQSGKGAEISASFGGSSQTVFGSSGGANFFQKLTYTLAAIFMITSLTLTILPNKVKHSVFEGYTPAGSTTVPNTTVPARVPPTGQVPDPSAPGGVPADAAAPAAGNGAPGPANKTNPVSGATEKK